MPSTLSEAATQAPLNQKDRAVLWLYRIGAYLLINVIDDPAWLALMFC
jgi:hypothetical protein